ncbi:hypothetical protein K502DRAFT_320601 [Neoconidiobolus thromboides FSU 785]|nr:hypothetical protein K502DRAFT_320601 [Neoconidiobolus thromboides FSU 785]
MICRLNALRRENGKKDILLDYRVMAAAQKHAEAMKQNDNLTHDGFTPETKGFIDRVHLEGYTGGAGAENICQGSGNVVDVLTCWKNSPGHLENMLSDNECFGYGRDDFFWVQDFVSGDKCQGYGDVDCTKFGL